MVGINKQIHLVSRPDGEARADNFRLVEAPVGEPKDGQVLVRNHFLSLDPYMRGRMNDAKSYAVPQPLDKVMQGGTAGEVVASKHPGYQPGDSVVGAGGWQQYTLVDATTPGVLRKVDATRIPLSAYLGAVGMPGVTAWYGLIRICEPKPGQTIVVSAASGAVGILKPASAPLIRLMPRRKPSFAISFAWPRTPIGRTRSTSNGKPRQPGCSMPRAAMRVRSRP